MLKTTEAPSSWTVTREKPATSSIQEQAKQWCVTFENRIQDLENILRMYEQSTTLPSPRNQELIELAHAAIAAARIKLESFSLEAPSIQTQEALTRFHTSVMTDNVFSEGGLSDLYWKFRNELLDKSTIPKSEEPNAAHTEEPTKPNPAIQAILQSERH